MFNLQLSEDRFWRATLREFDWLAERWRDSQDMIERRTGRVCASIFNAQGAKKADGKHFTESDFVPSEKEEQSVDEQKAILSRIGVKS